VLQISRQSIQARANYSDFKVLQKEEEKYEENKTNFEGAYLGRVQLKFGIGGATPRGNSHRKFHVLLFREC